LKTAGPPVDPSAGRNTHATEQPAQLAGVPHSR
jgi:hypothetical protein